MRVFAAIVGALLISASHPALAQKHHDGMPQGKKDQSRPASDQPQQTPKQPGSQSAVKEQDQQRRQPEALKSEMQQDHPPEIPHDPQWSPVNEQGLGTTVDLPRAVFSQDDGHAYKDVGRRYKTPDGRAKVSIWTQPGSKHETPAGYLSKTFDIPRNTVDYDRKTPGFAAVSGVSGGKVYYIRCNLQRKSGTMHCFDLAYPAAEKKAWDGIVVRMSRSLRPQADEHRESGAQPAPPDQFRGQAIGKDAAKGGKR